MKIFKKTKRFFKKPKKSQRALERKDSLMTPATGYTSTPNFMIANKRYANMTVLSNYYGLNRRKQYGWFINVIPEINIDSVRGYFIEVSKPVASDEQLQLIGAIEKTKKSIMNSQKETSAENSEAKQDQIKDLSDARTKHSKEQDIIIDSQIRCMLVSDDANAIEEQLKNINTYYNETMYGLSLSSLPGQQDQLFKGLFRGVTSNLYDNTMMAFSYAGFDHMLKRVLNDEKGVPIGDVSQNVTLDTEAMFDLNKRFKSKVLVASPDFSIVGNFDPKLSSASLWGQKIANHAMAYGHRTFHIVLNDFEYYGSDDDNRFRAEEIMNTVIKKYDLSKGGINILEQFGDREDAARIYYNKLESLTYSIHLLLRQNNSKDMRTLTNKILNEFFLETGLWNKQASKYPEKARTIVRNHASYPTLGRLVADMTILGERLNEQGKGRIEDVEDLEMALEGILNTNFNAFGGKTTLEHPNENRDIYQFYYELDRLSKEAKEVQFISVFDYIYPHADEGDIIMIHGMDQLSKDTTKFMKDSLKKIEKNGVRIAFLFDKVGNQAEDPNKDESDVEYADIFNVRGHLYQDIENDFDYTITGSMTQHDLKKYEYEINQTLPLHLKSIMLSNEKVQYMIRSSADDTTSFVAANFLI
ncbi:hypothetical protein [Mammaliicoccus sp. E-M21]|uniref:hypothetical protein n=1 Tax=Mammaliicoccus sp. E-M21 TaxID=2898681 RepID=UPI001EFB2189|nr:hypothetical protein [Mammaliicoccus sp. E-M21]